MDNLSNPQRKNRQATTNSVVKPTSVPGDSRDHVVDALKNRKCRLLKKLEHARGGERAKIEIQIGETDAAIITAGGDPNDLNCKRRLSSSTDLGHAQDDITPSDSRKQPSFGGNAPMSPKEAKRKIMELRGNDAHMKILEDRLHPDFKTAQGQFNELYQTAYPDPKKKKRPRGLL